MGGFFSVVGCVRAWTQFCFPGVVSPTQTQTHTDTLLPLQHSGSVCVCLCVSVWCSSILGERVSQFWTANTDKKKALLYNKAYFAGGFVRAVFFAGGGAGSVLVVLLSRAPQITLLLFFNIFFFLGFLFWLFTNDQFQYSTVSVHCLYPYCCLSFCIIFFSFSLCVFCVSVFSILNWSTFKSKQNIETILEEIHETRKGACILVLLQKKKWWNPYKSSSIIASFFLPVKKANKQNCPRTPLEDLFNSCVLFGGKKVYFKCASVITNSIIVLI